MPSCQLSSVDLNSHWIRSASPLPAFACSQVCLSTTNYRCGWSSFSIGFGPIWWTFRLLSVSIRRRSRPFIVPDDSHFANFRLIINILFHYTMATPLTHPPLCPSLSATAVLHVEEKVSLSLPISFSRGLQQRKLPNKMQLMIAVNKVLQVVGEQK